MAGRDRVDVGLRDRSDRERRRDHELAPRRRRRVEPARGAADTVCAGRAALRTCARDTAQAVRPAPVPRSVCASETMARTSRRSHAARRAGVISSGPASAATAAARIAARIASSSTSSSTWRRIDGQPRRLQEAQRRKRQPLRPSLHEDVDQRLARRPPASPSHAAGFSQITTGSALARQQEIAQARAGRRVGDDQRILKAFGAGPAAGIARETRRPRRCTRGAQGPALIASVRPVSRSANSRVAPVRETRSRRGSSI